jgi:hypothetical protein
MAATLDSNDKRPKVDAEKAFTTISSTLWAQKLYNEYTRDLVIFGTSHPFIYKKPTLWERIKWPLRNFFRRVRDAWKVLIGRAEIYDGQDD